METFYALSLIGEPLLAYVGPGPGLSMTWALLGLILTILSAVFAILFWPLRIMLRKMRGTGDEAEGEDDDRAERVELADADDADSVVNENEPPSSSKPAA